MIKNRFINKTINTKIKDAIVLANQYLDADSDLMQAIKLKNDWKYPAGLKGIDVYLNLYRDREPVDVYTYKPFNVFSAAIGYFDGDSIHLNLRKLDSMSVNDVAGCLVHEYGHYCNYGHGSNWPSEDKNNYSVPYFCSTWAGRNL